MDTRQEAEEGKRQEASGNRHKGTDRMKSYRELLVWQKGMALVDEVYRWTKNLPKQEQYVLADQVRRAAISVPTNIAEGYGRQSTQDYIRFLLIARGSVYELRTLLEIARRQGFLRESEFELVDNLAAEIERMLTSLIKKLRNPP